MPELPEVETICRGLRKTVLNKRISRVEVFRPQIIKSSSSSEFIRNLVGRRITAVERRAKYLKILLEGGGLLLCHLRMTGGFLYFPDHGKVGKHTRALFCFTDGSSLHYEDLRALGVIKLYDSNKPVPELEKLGVEPHSSDFTTRYLKTRLARSGKPIRDWLLDQSQVVGVGNIYASEILFRSRINPFSSAHCLTGRQTADLQRETVRVLKEAIDCCGTTFSDYMRVGGETGGFQKFLRVYKKEGLPCISCSTTIKRVKLHQRSVFFCPGCQRVGASQQ